MEQEIKQLKERVNQLENLINFVIKADRYTFPRDLDLRDAVNIRVGSENGTKIGTTASQKIGFYGKSPVSQYAPASTISFTPVSGTGDDTDINNNFNSIISWSDDINSILEGLGLTS